MAKTVAWGILPDDAIAQLRKKEWDHPRHLKQRLRHQRPFPIVLSLKAPTGQQAFADMDHFHTFFKTSTSDRKHIFICKRRTRLAFFTKKIS